VFLTGKTGYTRVRRTRRTQPVRHLPNPTRTGWYGLGRVYPRVRGDPHTSKLWSQSINSDNL